MKVRLEALNMAVAIFTFLAPVPALAASISEETLTDETGFVLLEHRQTAVQASEGPNARIALNVRKDAPALPRRGFAARGRMLPAVRAAEVRHRLPIGLLDALIATESGYSPWAISRAGAGGLAQLMPATATELGVMNRFDPVQSIEGGARYLRRMLDRFGSISLALAAYNAGPGSVLRAGGIPYNGETAGYVAQVLRRWSRLSLD